MKFQSHSDKMVVGICALVLFLVGPTLQMVTDKLQIDSAISKQKSIQVFFTIIKILKLHMKYVQIELELQLQVESCKVKIDSIFSINHIKMKADFALDNILLELQIICRDQQNVSVIFDYL